MEYASWEVWENGVGGSEATVPVDPASNPGSGPDPNYDPDSDGDGLTDSVENAWGSNPNVVDTDGGGASDSEEYHRSPQSDPNFAGDDVEEQPSPSWYCVETGLSYPSCIDCCEAIWPSEIADWARNVEIAKDAVTKSLSDAAQYADEFAQYTQQSLDLEAAGDIDGAENALVNAIEANNKKDQALQSSQTKSEFLEFALDALEAAEEGYRTCRMGCASHVA